MLFVLRQTKYEDLKKSVETPKGKQLQQKVSQEKKCICIVCALYSSLVSRSVFASFALLSKFCSVTSTP